MLTELGERFAAAGHELALVGGPVRDAFLGRVSPDLDFTTDARPDEILAVVLGLGRRALGHRPRVRHDRRCARAPHVIEVTTYRADAYDRTSRKPEVMFGDTPRGRPRASRLHGQRHGGAAARRSSSSTPTAGWPTSRSAGCARRRRPRSPSPTTRCG